MEVTTIVRMIVFVGICCFAVMFLYVGVTQYFMQRRILRNAVPVEVEIIYSQVFSSTSANTDRRVGRSTSTTTHRPDVRFRYHVTGRQYESDLMYPIVIVHGSPSREDAAEALAPYPVGAKVSAHVDPAHPDKAFLIAEPRSGPLVFTVLGVLIPIIGWWAVKLI